MIDYSLIRFFEKVKISDACWLWTGSKSRKGYGRFRVDGKLLIAHRYSYELHHGEFPKTKLVCHSCDNPPCINPKHLFIGDAKTNAMDSVIKGRQVSIRKTKCPRGHEYSKENTYYIKSGNRNISRRCKICNTNSCREMYRRRRIREQHKSNG